MSTSSSALGAAAVGDASNDGNLLSQTFHRLRTNPQEILLMDGGTGEELFRHGVPDDRKIWSAKALVDAQYHDTLQKVHQSFLEAGASSITTNSYGVVPGVGFDNIPERSKYIHLAGQIARQAANAHNNKKSLVFGSLGPLLESYRADLIKNHDEGVADYQVACQALEPNVDAYLAETMSCVEETSQALEAIHRLADNSGNKPKPLLVSFTLDSKGNLRDQEKVTDAIRRLLKLAKDKSVQVMAFLFNCCEPEAITLALARIRADKELRQLLNDEGILLGAYANRLTAVDPNWTMADSEAAQPFRDDMNEQHYWNDFVRLWIGELNVKLIGGCCGITPEHIAYIRKELDKRQPTLTRT